LGVLMNLGLVFAGGGCGAVLRYLVVLGMDALLRDAEGLPGGGRLAGLPLGTLAANVLGSFLIGVVGGVLVAGGGESEDDTREAWRLLVVVGVLGGFTTMSSFAAETVRLFEARQIGLGIGYVVLTNALCVGAAVAGGSLQGSS
jgi:CrcB protein